MSADLKYWFLHDHKLFRNLSFAEIDELCILKRFKKSRKNEIIDLPYSEKERIFFLKHGTIKLINYNIDGDEVLVDILQKGDLFGELNLEKPTEQEGFLKVVSDEAIICTFFKEKLEALIHKKPDFALNYIKFMGFNFKKIQNSYKNILFKDAKTRLLLLFRMLYEKDGSTSKTFFLPNYLTQKDMSQLICTTRQTVISLLKTMEEEGIIRYHQNAIEIPDIEKLENLLQNVK